jgi:hypothetical protein
VIHSTRSLALAAICGAILLGTGAGIVLMGPARPAASPSASPTATWIPSPTPSGHTGNEQLDEVIDLLVSGTAPELERRFRGVTAREGALIGGPIGLYQPGTVDAPEWIERLAAAKREVHAVVKDPVEPFEWWDQPPLDQPRAAIFAGTRDFDVVLIVTPPDAEPQAWRFSLEDGRIVDAVIDGGPGPGGDEVPLVRKLGYLTPSPDSEPERFLVLPPHEMRPPPAALGHSMGSPPPAPVTSRSFAPSGRTGITSIDTIIDRLVLADEATLSRSYPDLAARESTCDPSCEDVRVAPSAWTSRLAATQRSLYAVFTGDPVGVEVLLAVDGGSTEAQSWRFIIDGGSLATVDIFMPPSPGGPVDSPFVMVRQHAPSPVSAPERFYVLPPRSELPEAPRVHAAAVRTGIGGVDGLLEKLEARDAPGLVVAIEDGSSVYVRDCTGEDWPLDAGFVNKWSRDLTAQLFGIYGVVHVPAQFEPVADHLLIAYRQIKPYWWAAAGILERDGRIVGLITGDWSCEPERMYPPSTYLVPPPDGGLDAIDPMRRSGIAIVDEILDAAAAGYAPAMDDLIDYTKEACGDPSGMPPGAGPPSCPSGVADGTLVEILPYIVCEGGHLTRENAPGRLIETIGLASGAGLYAATASTDGRAVVIAKDRGGVRLIVTDRGVKQVWLGCGPQHPDALLGSGAPTFLLPPP